MGDGKEGGFDVGKAGGFCRWGAEERRKGAREGGENGRGMGRAGQGGGCRGEAGRPIFFSDEFLPPFWRSTFFFGRVPSLFSEADTAGTEFTNENAANLVHQ